MKQLFKHAAIGIAGGFVLFVAVFAVSEITAQRIGKQWIYDCLLYCLFAFAAIITLLTLLLKNKSLLGALIRFLALFVSHVFFYFILGAFLDFVFGFAGFEAEDNNAQGLLLVLFLIAILTSSGVAFVIQAIRSAVTAYGNRRLREER